MWCNDVMQCHYSGNFATRDMILMSLIKNLTFEQYDGEVNSNLSLFEI